MEYCLAARCALAVVQQAMVALLVVLEGLVAQADDCLLTPATPARCVLLVQDALLFLS